TFAVIEGKNCQVIHDHEFRPLAVISSDTGREAGELRIRELAAEQMREPFDLAKGPLIRLGLLCLSPTRHVIFCTLHHSVADGWSMSVMMREVAALYEAFSSGKSSPLSELPVQYADYAMWQRTLLSGDRLRTHTEYW